MARVRLEFTVEPFADAAPGPHVRAAVAAVEAAGLPTDFGPFSTEATGELATVAGAVAGLLEAAFAAGASRVTLHVEQERRA
jgi:uncharacterized protein YqgV (UPF0045/DUF77 family)